MKIEIKYDKKADAVYLYFSNEKVAFSKELDRERTVDYSEDGEIRGIRFSSASTGLNTGDLPHRSAIERALYDNGITELNDRLVTDLRKDAGNPVKPLPKKQMKAKVMTLIWASVAILAFIGFIVVDVLMSRNLFVLRSELELMASLFGLTVALFPTVIGSFILLLFVLDARSQDSRP